MSNKLLGKAAVQGAIFVMWKEEDITTTEAALASWSIWGDELVYVGTGYALRHPLSAPFAAAYIASEAIQDPETANEYLDEYYRPAIEYIGADLPRTPEELLLGTYYSYSQLKKEKSNLKKFFDVRRHY